MAQHGRELAWDRRRRNVYTRTARSGNNKFTASREQGGTNFSASGRTQQEAYRNLRKGFGQSGG